MYVVQYAGIDLQHTRLSGCLDTSVLPISHGYERCGDYGQCVCASPIPNSCLPSFVQHLSRKLQHTAAAAKAREIAGSRRCSN